MLPYVNSDFVGSIVVLVDFTEIFLSVFFLLELKFFTLNLVKQDRLTQSTRVEKMHKLTQPRQTLQHVLARLRLCFSLAVSRSSPSEGINKYAQPCLGFE